MYQYCTDKHFPRRKVMLPLKGNNDSLFGLFDNMNTFRRLVENEVATMFQNKTDCLFKFVLFYNYLTFYILQFNVLKMFNKLPLTELKIENYLQCVF